MHTAPAVGRYDRLLAALRGHADLGGALRLLEWDQETFMPAGALASRVRQIGALTTVLHERQTAPDFLALVDDLSADLARLAPAAQVDVRETKWRLDRVRRFDAAFLRDRAMLHAEARALWVEARRNDDFGALRPYLERIVDTERQAAGILDPSVPPYGALLEEYEPGACCADFVALFAELRQGLLACVERLRRRLGAGSLPVDALCGHFPLDQQQRLNRLVAERIGFDFERGRLDEAAHPFTTTIGADVRLTTRYDERDLRYALFSTIHETGHGLYEQGLDPEAFGTPRGTSCSLGVHESQSRLWENFVARSEGFWRFLLPTVRQAFPQLAASVDEVLIAVNAARPSLIRTEADEITYNLHIVLRFELERALIDGDLPVAELPGAWRQQMRDLLGVVPDTDREGVLQDVHWPSGAIGYFPTYALGNLYAAQLVEAAEAAVGDLNGVLAAGEFGTLLGWLRQHVHRHGQTHRAEALITAATGRAPTAAPLLAHLDRKLALLEAL
jgi:carboxypeptidase Taq